MEYIKGADGQMYREDDDGNFVPAENGPGVEYVEAGGGRYYAREVSNRPAVEMVRDEQDNTVNSPEIRDVEEYERQRQDGSHEEFFDKKQRDESGERLKTVTEEQYRAKLRRQEAMQKQLEDMVQSQIVDPGAGAGNIQRIKDEAFMELQAMYGRAVREGWSEDCEYQPLNTYRTLVQRARPIFQGEVGIKVSGGKKGMKAGNPVQVICLEEGYGKSPFIQVGIDLAAGPDDSVSVITGPDGVPMRMEKTDAEEVHKGRREPPES